MDCPAHLPWALLGLRAAPKEVSGLSSAEAVFGQPLVLPGELGPGEEAGPAEFSMSLASSTPPLTSQPRTYAEAVAGPPDWCLQLASMVYIRRGGSGPPLAPAYAGPFKVVRPGHKYFVVEVGGRQESVSVDCLKPHLGTSPLPAASPPRRGRPRESLHVTVQPRPSLGLGGSSVEAGDVPGVSRKSANIVQYRKRPNFDHLFNFEPIFHNIL